MCAHAQKNKVPHLKLKKRLEVAILTTGLRRIRVILQWDLNCEGLLQLVEMIPQLLQQKKLVRMIALERPQ